MINLGFRSDSSGKNGWDTLSDLGGKEAPFPRLSINNVMPHFLLQW